MVREMITLNVGGAGIQLGQSVWRQYCAEHKIYPSGEKKKTSDDDKGFLTFYEETDSGQYVARNLMVDLESTVIDNVKISKYAKLFQPEFLLAGKEDSGNNFARGHYTVGKKMIKKVNDQLRKLVESCDNLQGFIMNHSVAGGTGSGLGCLVLKRIASDYPKKYKIGFEVYPSSEDTTRATDVYNSLLTTHLLVDHSDVNVVYDNEKIYEICQRDLKIKRPSYQNMNRLISKNISSVTTSFRFEGELNVDLQRHLAPAPRLHFLIPSMSPIVSKIYNGFDSVYKSIDNSPLINELNVPPIINEEIAEYATSLGTVKQSVAKITKSCADSKSFLLKVDDFDVEKDKYMAIFLMYRGDAKDSKIYPCIHSLKANKKVTIVEWCPSYIGYGCTYKNYAILKDDDISASKRSVAMLGNNTAIGRFLSERISKKYDAAHSQKADVHLYVAEGMEEEEFEKAREDLSLLEKDYAEASREETPELY